MKAFTLTSLLLGTATAFQHSLKSPIARSSSSKLILNLEHCDSHDDDATIMARRSFCTRSLRSIAGITILSSASPSIAFAADETAKLETYEDTDFNFRVQFPSSWTNTVQDLSGRRKGIFYTDPNSKDPETDTIETLGFIAFTPLRDDFTGLGSFGSVDNVAQTVILPKGELAGQNDKGSKMLSAESKKNAYYFDYVTTPVVPVEPGTSSTAGGAAVLTKTLKQQHFRTIFTMLPLKNSAGLTLVTITLQTTEERYGDLKGVFDQVIDSYGKM